MTASDDPHSGMWRDRDWLVMRSSLIPPKVCFTCGETRTGPALLMKFVADDPGVASIPVVPEIILAPMKIVSGSSAEVTISICEDCREANRNVRLAQLIRVAFILAVLLLLLIFQSIWIVLVLAFAVMSSIWTWPSPKFVRADKIADGYVWLEGVHESFLNKLPIAAEPHFDSTVRDPGGHVETLIPSDEVASS